MSELRLLELLRWSPEGGYFLLEAHLARLERAAAWWLAQPASAGLGTGGAEFILRREASEALVAMAAALEGGEGGTTKYTKYTNEADLPAYKVRLLAGWEAAGSWKVETQAEALPDIPQSAFGAQPPAAGELLLRLGLAPGALDAADPFLYHKTTRRELYQAARAARPDCDDTLLWNANGEATEASASNLVALLDGALVTPPLECGLLPGVFRGWLLEQGVLQERRLPVEQLESCERIWLVNSVRGWREAVMA